MICSKVKGLFKMTVRKADGSIKQETDWIPNLITNAGLEQIGTGSWFAACHVGTNNTAPAVTDTALGGFVAGSNTLQADDTGSSSSSPYYGWRRKTFRFAAGAAAGNLSEVGIASAASNGGSTVLITRALILDGSNNPTTITVLSDEVLDVTYELRLYPATESDSTGTITISGVTHSYTIRPAQLGSATIWGDYIGSTASHNPTSGADYGAYNGAIGAITSLPSGTSAGFDVTNSTYGANTKYRDCTVTLGLNSANLSGGIRSFKGRTTLGAYQIELSPTIDKTSTKVLNLTFRISWDRV